MSVSGSRRVLACLLLLLSAATASLALWQQGKAHLAQYLMERSWARSQLDSPPERPWPWADVRPVARLQVPALAQSVIALSDASGEAMAFGPGLVTGDPLEAQRQTLAFGGHRDTHLAFLEHVRKGMHIVLDDSMGAQTRYEVVHRYVIDVRYQTVAVAPESPGLLLITCYPFDARVVGGPERLVVMARRLGRPQSATQTSSKHHQAEIARPFRPTIRTGASEPTLRPNTT